MFQKYPNLVTLIVRIITGSIVYSALFFHSNNFDSKYFSDFKNLKTIPVSTFIGS